MQLLCWNVNGLRAVHRKGLFLPWVRKMRPDVLCLQETKAQPEQLEDVVRTIDGYTSHYCSAERKGYSGVALYTRPVPERVTCGFGEPKFDVEGRVLCAEYPAFTLFSIYFPNGGRSPERLQYKLDFYDAILAHWQKLRRRGKRLVICGDVNTAHKEIDVAKPREWSDDSGFLPVERKWIDTLVDHGYVDIFRRFNTEPEQYTFWDPITRARIRNEGWRIDYFFVTEDLVPSVRNATILPDVFGSDHCPIGLEIAA